jgi:hypothetical protein
MWKLVCYFVLLSCVSVTLCEKSPVIKIGGGNFPNGQADDAIEAQFAVSALHLAGTANCKLHVSLLHYFFCFYFCFYYYYYYYFLSVASWILSTVTQMPPMK